MEPTIEVVNHHHLDGDTDGTIYIGRPGRGEEGHPLANPRPRANNPQDTLEAYERELRAALDKDVQGAAWGTRSDGSPRTLTEKERVQMRDAMNHLYLRARREGRLRLRCFCAPRPCHGDVIRTLLLEAFREAGT